MTEGDNYCLVTMLATPTSSASWKLPVTAFACA